MQDTLPRPGHHERLFRVTGIAISAWNRRAPFCAGFTLRNGVVDRCAPILRRAAVRQRLEWVLKVCAQRGWSVEEIGKTSGQGSDSQGSEDPAEA